MSLKIVLAIKPHGLAGPSGGKDLPLTDFNLGSISLFIIIGSQSLWIWSTVSI